MKKALVLLIALLFIVVPMAGCQTSGGGDATTTAGTTTGATTTGATTTAATTASGGGDITLTVALNMDLQEVFEAFMRDFERKNPGIKIDLVPIPPTIAEYVQPAIASNTMPDALSVNSDDYSRKLADEGWLMDLKGTQCDELLSDGVKSFFTSGSGMLYGLPYGVSTVLMFYNKAMFSDFGITEMPQDWDSFVEMCEIIKGNGVAPMSLAVADSAGNTVWSYAFANNIIPGNASWQEQMTDGSFDFMHAGIEDIFDKVKTLSDNGYLQDGAVSAQYQQSIDAFNQGLTAMFFGGSWFATAIEGVADFEVGAFVPPYNDAGKEPYVMLGPETGWGGSGKTENPEAVLALLTHFVGDGRNILQNGRGSIPVTKETSGSILPKVVDSVLGDVMGSTLTAPMYFVYLPTVFQTDLHKLMQDVVLGALSPSDAADEMQIIFDGSF